jgi:predicted dehydrogenase
MAVIGVGHLGQHHARILAETDRVDLVGVVDIDRARAEKVSAACGGVPAATDARDLAGHVDAVTIAVPTSAHLDVALPFLERGIAVLVEKPMTASVEEADRFVQAAAEGGAVVGVGHTERHNPAVVTATPLVRAPKFVEVHRLGAFPGRSLDIDVVFDLMIHDIDVVLALVGTEIESVEAVGVAVLTDRVDIANARLRFASGCIANLTASRISLERVRKLRFFQPHSYVSIDCVEQEVERWEVARHPDRPPSIDGGKLPIAKEEPLKRLVDDFVDAIVAGRSPIVSAEDGRRALEVAARITTAIERSAPAEGLGPA